MNHAVSLLPAEAIEAETAPACIVETHPSVSCSTAPAKSVGAVPRALTDEEREAAIKKAGDLVVKYMALANEGDYFHWRGLADRARLSMEALIKGRSAGWKRADQEKGAA